MQFGVVGILSILASCIGCRQPTPTPTEDVAVRPTVRDDATTRPTQNAIEVPPPAPSQVPAAPSALSPPLASASVPSTGSTRPNGKIVKAWFDPDTGGLRGLLIDGTPEPIGCFYHRDPYSKDKITSNSALNAVALAAMAGKFTVEASFDPDSRCILSIAISPAK
jgi:hypothetical protein